MMIQKNQVLLNEFKKSYIFNKANEMAQDYEFIKGFTLNKVKTYIQLLSIFWKENNDKINAFLKAIKNGKKIDKTNLFLKELTFIIAIPQLIRVDGSEVEVDYVFLKNTFKKNENNSKLIELKSSLKELEKEFISVDNDFFLKNYSVNIGLLYNFGSFILNFLNNIELRTKICIDLLDFDLEIKNEKIENIFQEEIIQNRKNINSWSSNNMIQI